MMLVSFGLTTDTKQSGDVAQVLELLGTWSALHCLAPRSTLIWSGSPRSSRVVTMSRIELFDHFNSVQITDLF